MALIDKGCLYHVLFSYSVILFLTFNLIEQDEISNC